MAHILVIDDDEMLREVIAKTLELAGHSVARAEDGLQGLDVFRAQPAELVITDLIMPRQEGVETIMKLRKEFPGLRIIAMSGGVSHSKLYLEMAGKLGAHKLLPKPFTPTELIRVVSETLAGPPPARR